MRFQAPESLSEQIAQHLATKIIRGDMKPKERIQELKIAKELEVSRGSVREALLVLERRYLINILPRKGAIVSELSPMHVNALYDMYINLLTMLVRKYAQEWTDSDMKVMVKKVETINKMIALPEKPVEQIVEAGFELMMMSFSVVNNPYLEDTLENFRQSIGRTYFLAMGLRREELDKTREFFSRLVDVVYKRDMDAIPSVVQDYGENQRRLVLLELETLNRDHASEGDNLSALNSPFSGS